MANGSFETGDLTGWLPGGDYDLIEVQEGTYYSGPAFDGTYTAYLETTDQTNNMWLEQSVAVVPGTTYAGSVQETLEFGGVFGVQILEPDGTLIASAPTEFSYPDPWGPAEVLFTARTDTVKFRLNLFEYGGEQSYGYFDDARLVAAQDAGINLGFEQGDLAGWVTQESGDGTVDVEVVTSPVLEGSYAALVHPYSNNPNGISQEAVPLGNCTYVNARLEAGSQATARLEVEAPDGSTYASSVILSSTGVWEFIETFHPWLETGATVRLLVVNGSSTDVVFDNVVAGGCT